jgi:hypothetical protein
MRAFSLRGKKSEQRLLKIKLEQLFPGIEIVEEYYHPELSWGMCSVIIVFIITTTIITTIRFKYNSLENSDRRFELDIWIPKYRIGFEYQGENFIDWNFIVYSILGEHHFHNLESAFGPNGTTNLYLERDLTKFNFCQERGITLIVIPYWYGFNSIECIFTDTSGGMAKLIVYLLLCIKQDRM